MSTIDILLVGAHSRGWEAVRQALASTAGIVIAAQAADAVQALPVLRDKLARIVVAGLDEGVGLASALKASGLAAACVLVAPDLDEAGIAEALRSGARACVLLAEVPLELEPAIRAAARGEIHLSLAVSKKMIKWFAREGGVCGS